jgi:hypothetical protein
MALVLVLSGVAPSGPLRAQDAGMPFRLSEGNRYERRSVSADGELESVQRITVGDVVERDGLIEVLVVSHGFDLDGQPSDSVHTRISCRPDGADMVMNLLALVQPDGRDIELSLKGGTILYPQSPEPGPLPDVVLEASVEEGVVGFLGGRSQIVLGERTVILAPDTGELDSPGAYAITSRIELKFYVLGIRVRSKRYDAQETVSGERGLLRLVLTSEDGSSMTLSLVTADGV